MLKLQLQPLWLQLLLRGKGVQCYDHSTLQTKNHQDLHHHPIGEGPLWDKLRIYMRFLSSPKGPGFIIRLPPTSPKMIANDCAEKYPSCVVTQLGCRSKGKVLSITKISNYYFQRQFRKNSKNSNFNYVPSFTNLIMKKINSID